MTTTLTWKVLFLAAIISISVSGEFECPDRYCYVTRNDRNQSLFNCSRGPVPVTDPRVSLLQCFYYEPFWKVIVKTSDRHVISVDEVAEGAISRLVSGILVNQLYLPKLTFRTLDQTTFQGLDKMIKMSIANPGTMAPDTFVALASKKSIFTLTFSCTDTNPGSFLQGLMLASKFWRLETIYCFRKLKCEYSSCEKPSESTLSRITSVPSGNQGQGNDKLSFQSCSVNPSCNDLQQIPGTILPSIPSVQTTTTPHPRLPKSIPRIKPKTDRFYDSLIRVVLVLVSVNTFVIAAILFFLIFWWRRFSYSDLGNMNHRHTIILDDEDENDLDTKESSS